MSGSPRRLRKLAVLGLLALVFGQVALLTHGQADADHGDEVCAICLTGDRLEHGLAGATVSFAADYGPTVRPLRETALPAQRRTESYRARAPPKHL